MKPIPGTLEDVFTREEQMGGTQPNEKRRRKMYSITLSDEEVERLDEISARWGTNRSAAIARLVREAPLPRPIG